MDEEDRLDEGLSEQDEEGRAAGERAPEEPEEAPRGPVETSERWHQTVWPAWMRPRGTVSTEALIRAVTEADRLDRNYRDLSENGVPVAPPRLPSAVETLRHQIAVLEAQKETKRAQNHALSTAIELLKRQLQELESKNAEKDRTIQDQATEIAGLHDQLEALNEENNDLKGQVAARQADAEEKDKTIVGGFEGRLLASAMAKPPPFSGKGLLVTEGGQQVEDWMAQVRRYTKGLPVSPAAAVAIATSLLQSEAARAWDSHEAALQGKPATLDDVKQCLLQRFTPAATGFQARERLDRIQLGKGGGGTLAGYVTEFDKLCAMIPDLQEPEKVHRFISGIKHSPNFSPALLTQCCVDPATSAFYTEYSRMRTAALNASAHAAEIRGAVDRMQQRFGGGDRKRGRSGQ